MFKACDWAHTKELYIVNESLQKSKIEKRDTVLVETGCPKQLMKKFEDNGNVMIIPGQDIKKYRDKLGEEKSDENDAKLIMKYFQEYPKKFKKWNSENSEIMQLLNNLNIYDKTTKIIVGIKNNLKAQEREFGNKEGRELLEILEKVKIELLKPVDKWVKPYLSKVEDIKGLGKRILGGILLTAHPNKFKGKSSYLNYLGLTKYGKSTKKYNRNVKSLYYLGVDGVIKNKNKSPTKFSRMYDDIKEKLRIEHPEKIKDNEGKTRWNNGHIDAIARNKVMTELAKEVWIRFHYDKV